MYSCIACCKSGSTHDVRLPLSSFTFFLFSVTKQGTTCHQCRQKTIDLKTVCHNKNCCGTRGQVRHYSGSGMWFVAYHDSLPAGSVLYLM